MRLSALRIITLFVVIGTILGCANIVPPEGGKKDTRPPKLLSVNPPDSLLNTRISKIELHYNEFIELNNPAVEVQVSPLLPFPPAVTAVGKRVTIKIPDSLYQENTTYRITTGSAIKDLHEGNIAKVYTYSFSTGSYFDSLELRGVIYDAATGLLDTNAFVVLYPAHKSDSVVVKEKPMYVVKAGSDGNFAFKGLPKRNFRVYALHDANNNLIYDGKGEMIAFIDSIITPVDSAIVPVVLKSFKEVIIDTLPANIVKTRINTLKDKKNKDAVQMPLAYKVEVDTTSVTRRSFDITRPLVIVFEHKTDTINKQRIYLSYDSAGISVESPFTIAKDTSKPFTYLITSQWKEDSVYTLRLQKGFAKDSSGNETLSGKYSFRTKNDDDYAKLAIHLLPKYKDRKYILMVCAETDTVYNKPVTDTVVNLKKLKPGGYKMRIIIDENKNGKWDTGDLFEKRQPEEVIPYLEPIQLKAGWDSIIDFEKEKPRPQNPSSPEKRDKPPVK